MKLQAETGAVIDCLAKAAAPDTEGISDWLNVCTEIKENLQAVDDATPERYPNRMIADLSDMLEDTSAIAVDVGQHMVWSYQSFKNHEGQKLLFSGGHGAMATGFRQLSERIMQPENRPPASAETVHSK